MTKRFLKDMAERTIATYIQAFIGLLLVSGVTDLSLVKTSAIAAIPAALAVIKAGLAKLYSDTDSAGFVE